MAKHMRLFSLTLIIFLLSTLVIMPATAQGAGGDSGPDNTITMDPDAAAQGLVQATGEAAEGISGVVNRLVQRLRQAPAHNDIVRVLLIVGGVVLLFAGWRVYNFIILLSGALFGATIAVSLVANSGPAITTAAFLLGGVVGAVLAIGVYYLAVALIGAYIGLLFTTTAAAAFGWTPVPVWVLLIIAIIGAVIMVALSFELLVLYSSIVGAQMLALALGLRPIWVLILIVAGVIIQILLTRSFGYQVRRRPARNPLRNSSTE